MCGLVGYMNLKGMERHIKRTNQLESWARQAIFVDALRGQDGTGAAKVLLDGSIEGVEKLPVTSSIFLSHGCLERLFSGPPTRIFIGHNRKATLGGVHYNSTHPFWVDDVVLAHNGTLTSTGKEKGAQQIRTGYTDSEEVAHSLALAKDPMDVLTKLVGAYALTWYNQQTKALYLARNSERSLFICTTKDRESFLWASEEWMLSGLGARCGLELDEVFSLRELRLVSIDMDEKKLPKLGELKGKPYEEPVTLGYHGQNNRNNHSAVPYSDYGNEWDYPFDEYRSDNRGKNGWEIGNNNNDNNNGGGNNDRVLPEELYDTLKVKKGEEVPIKPLSFVPYSGAEKGTATVCVLLPETPFQGKLYSMPSKEFYANSGSIGWATVDGITNGFNKLEVSLRMVDPRFPEGKKALSALARKYLKEHPHYSSGKDMITMIKGPAGIHIPESEWKKLVKGGCSGCGEAISTKDVDDIFWIQSDQPLCKGCHINWKKVSSVG